MFPGCRVISDRDVDVIRPLLIATLSALGSMILRWRSWFVWCRDLSQQRFFWAAYIQCVLVYFRNNIVSLNIFHHGFVRIAAI